MAFRLLILHAVGREIMFLPTARAMATSQAIILFTEIGSTWLTTAAQVRLEPLEWFFLLGTPLASTCLRADSSPKWASWDSIGTIPAALCAIPTGVVSQNGGTTTVDVTWDNSNAGFYGSYAGAAPVSRLLTTFDVWFYQGVAPPASYVVPGAGWTAGTTGIATSTATTLGMTVPWTSGQTTYMTRRFYAEGSPLPTASTNYTIVATPSGAPVITSASAIRSGLNTNVTWTSADESKVTGYQVMWAPAGSSDFSAIGSFIQPAGNNHTYTSSVRIPATGSYVVKVGASLIDGTTEYSSPANVTATNVIKNKSRVTPN